MTYPQGTVTFPAPAIPNVPADFPEGLRRYLEVQKRYVNAYLTYVHDWAQGVQKQLNSAVGEARKVTGDALTAANAGTVDTGDATSDAVINNIRTRVGEIEVILEANLLAEEN